MKKIVLSILWISAFLSLIQCNGPGVSHDPAVTEGNPNQDLVPIDRVRLKGSPRAIITWNGQMPKDTIGKFWNVGEISATTEGSQLKVKFKPDDSPQQSLDLFLGEAPVGSNVQLGVYSYRFSETENPQELDQIVILYSRDENTMETRLFKVQSTPPYIEEVNFNPPANPEFSPIPYIDFYWKYLNCYSDSNFRDLTRSYKYEGGRVLENNNTN